MSRARDRLGSDRCGPGPANARVNRAFDDGKHRNLVSIGGIWVPAWVSVLDGMPRTFANGNGARLVPVAVMAARWFVWRVMFNDQDKRWRLLVHRAPRRSLRWRVVRVEFFDSENAAKARAKNILSHWTQFVADGYDDAPRITAAERRALRKAT